VAEFVLHVHELQDGVSSHSFEVSGEWLREQLADLQGISANGDTGSITLSSTKRGREVLLKGEVKAILQVDCVRCVETFELPIEGDIEVLMAPGPAKEPDKVDEDEDEDEDDLGIEHYEGEEIALDELIRDTLLLEVPISPSCGDNCPGWEHLIG
jgi:uncharacterized protein